MNFITVELNEDIRTIKYEYKGELACLEYRCVGNPERKLPADVKERWLRDLRSGEFKQGTEGFLCVNDQYCCLGVLVKDKMCDRTVGDRVFGEVLLSLTKLMPTVPEYVCLSGTGSLPVSCVQSFEHAGSRAYDSLADMNDRGVPFEVIAQVIEDLL